MMDTELLFLESMGRDVFALARDFADGEQVLAHQHSVCQVLHTLTGVIHAETPGRAWAIPPGRALWLPAGTEHAFVMRGVVRVRTLYIRPAAARALPDTPTVVRVSDLLRELLIKAAETPNSMAGGADATPWPLLLPLVLFELKSAAHENLGLPWPTSEVAIRIADHIRADPGDRRPIAELAQAFGVGAKTLARRFRAETGMAPDSWRRQARLLTSLAKLEEGHRVTDVAFELGFQSVSSFSQAFRETFGMLPREARMASGR